MVNLLSLLKKNKAYIGIFFSLVFWGVLLYYPATTLHFSLLDDGIMLKKAHELMTLVSDGQFKDVIAVVLEPEHGRVRPIYWLSQSVFTWISFNNSFFVHFLRLILLFVSCILISKLLIYLKVNVRFVGLSLFFFLTSLVTFENYYRLGTQEVYLVIYYLIVVYLIFVSRMAKRVFWVFLISIFASLTKENFFLIGIPFIVVPLINLFLNRKLTGKPREQFVFGTVILLTGLPVVVIKSLYPNVQDDYSSFYQLSFDQIWTSAKVYLGYYNHYFFPVLHISLGYFLYFFYVFSTNRKKFMEKEFLLVVFWSQALVQFVFLLPWEFALGRYLLLVNVSLTLIFGITFHRLAMEIGKFVKSNINLKFSKNNYIFLLIVATVPFFFIRNIFDIANYQLWQKVDSEMSYQTIKAIGEIVPEGRKLFLNFKQKETNLELFKETGWHLDQIYNRGDLNVLYLDELSLCESGPSYIFDRTSDRFFDRDVLENIPGLEKLAQGSVVYRPINYGKVLRSFYFGTKLEGWNSEHYFDWSLYKYSGVGCKS